MTESAGVAWTVYIVRCRDDSLYTGIARDHIKRIAEHNAGTGAKFTRGRRPVRLVYLERVTDRGAALVREIEIKRLSRADKLALIANGARD